MSDTKAPQFKVGDIVKFELDRTKYVPRLCHTPASSPIDLGSSGTYIHGEVIHSDVYKIKVRYFYPQKTTTWIFFCNHADQPGFPQLVTETKMQNPCAEISVATRFKVGDIVYFELNSDCKEPRLSYKVISSIATALVSEGSGMYVIGKVTITEEDYFRVKVLDPSLGILLWRFYYSHFDQPGFPYLPTVATTNTCECGSWKTYGKNGPHADWCPLC